MITFSFEWYSYNIESVYKFNRGEWPTWAYNYTLYFPDNCTITLDWEADQNVYELVKDYLESGIKRLDF